MQQQPASTHGAEPATVPAELFLPRGGTDPDFHFPADRGRRPGRVSRWMNRLVTARSNGRPVPARKSATPQ